MSGVEPTATRHSRAPTAWPAAAIRVSLTAKRRSGDRTWLAALVSLIFSVSVWSSRTLSPDTYYDLYLGRHIVHHGIPRANVFTAASHGARWEDQQWLGHVVYYGAWAIGGYPALAFLSAALVTAGYAVLALVMLRRRVPTLRMFAWTCAAFMVGIDNLAVRAQSFGYLFFALTLCLLLADDRRPKPRPSTWLVLAVLVAWANTHGSVLLGAAMVGLYATWRAARALLGGDRQAGLAYLGLAAAGGMAVVCTPYGPGVLDYYARFIGNPALQHVSEWSRPSVLNPYCWAFFVMIAVAGGAAAIAWRRGARPHPFLVTLTLILLGLALTAMRNQVWFGFGASMLSADTLARGSGREAPALSKAFQRATAGILVLGAVVSSVVLVMTPVRKFASDIPQRAIGAAASIAAKHPAARVLGGDWAGTPMLWLSPATLGRVAFDIRVEQYTTAEMRAYRDFLFVHGPRWARVTRGYSIIVVSRTHHPRLARALTSLRGWRIVYRDPGGLVLVRERSPAARGSPRRP